MSGWDKVENGTAGLPLMCPPLTVHDDALDVFGVAATLGMIFTGVFATPAVNANLLTNLGGVLGHALWREQKGRRDLISSFSCFSGPVSSLGTGLLVGVF